MDEERRDIRVLFALLVGLAALHIADFATTFVSLQSGGTELNPIMAWVITHLGFTGLWLTKATMAAVMVALAMTIPQWQGTHPIMQVGVVVTAILMLLVVANNGLAIALA